MENIGAIRRSALLFMALTLLLGRSKGQMSSVLYPFGASVGDLELTIGDERAVRLSNFRFTFFGDVKSGIFINTNGVISFDKPFFQRRSAPFPLSDAETPVIAPYWIDIDTSRNNGTIYYRTIKGNSALARSASSALSKAFGCDYCPYAAFYARDGLLVTWEKVTYRGGSDSSSTVTFQALLLTDYSTSYVVYNYGDLGFSSNRPATIGFDAGDGKDFFNASGSGTPATLTCSDRSNVKIPGRWMYGVYAGIYQPE